MTTPIIIACMGGFCAKREHCMNFHAADRRWPSERLCAPSADGVGIEGPVVIRMPAGTWERGAGALLAPAEPLGVA